MREEGRFRSLLYVFESTIYVLRSNTGNDRVGRVKLCSAVASKFLLVMGTPIIRYYFMTTLAPYRRLAVDLKSEPEAERVQRIIIKTCAKSVRGLRVFYPSDQWLRYFTLVHFHFSDKDLESKSR